MASEGACAGKPTPPVATSGKGKWSVSNTRYGSPKRDKDVQNAQESAIPKKVKLNTQWAKNTWCYWTVHRVKNLL